MKRGFLVYLPAIKTTLASSTGVLRCLKKTKGALKLLRSQVVIAPLGKMTMNCRSQPIKVETKFLQMSMVECTGTNQHPQLLHDSTVFPTVDSGTLMKTVRFQFAKELRFRHFQKNIISMGKASTLSLAK